MSADEAVAWARRHATSVLVRIGTQLYTAGDESIPGLASWHGTPAAGEPPSGAASRDWLARACTRWHGREGEAVADGLAEAIAADGRATDVHGELSGRHVVIAFRLERLSEAEANRVASQLLRDAWRRLGIAALPGKDYDMSTLDVAAT